MTPEGELVARLGDPGVATHVRSAAKPFQALPLVLAGGIERFGLDAADLALICGSHGGRPEHAERVESLLARGGFTVRDLRCGSHLPMDPESAAALQRSGQAPVPFHHNCSGSHAGMLLACRLLDLPTEGYPDPEHPLQGMILEHMARLCGMPAEAIGVGIDGCSVPSYHLPVEAAARAYAVLAHPRGARIRGDGGDLTAALKRIVGALGKAPEMVAGPGRFTTRLIAATQGRVIGKEGADGFYGMAVRGPVALGIGLKIADGGERCRDGVLLDILRQLGSLAAAEFAELSDLYSPGLYSHGGTRVGEIVSEVELEEV